MSEELPVVDEVSLTPLSPDNEAVLKHVDMYQGIINRMAANSSASKNWCIVLVSAFLAFVITDGKTEFAWLIGIPIIIFWFLDAYYLGLEKQFRDAFKVSMEKLRSGTLMRDDLFKVEADGALPSHMIASMTSWSTWPVYIGLLALMTLAKAMV